MELALESLGIRLATTGFALSPERLARYSYSIGLWWRARRLRLLVDVVAHDLGKLQIETDEQRAVLEDLPATFSQIAKAWSQILEEAAQLPKTPWSLRIALRQYEAVMYRSEDIAETVALALSKEFTQLVEDEIEGPVNGDSTS
jgi:hypothetical protein